MALTLALLLAATTGAPAQVPQTLSYQGVLRDSGGPPVPDDDYLITFKIYDIASGGTALWTEPQTLPVSDGILNATLGSVVTLDLAFDVPYWLGISVGGEAELDPRVELTAAPYALRALHADVAQDSDWETSGNTVYRLTGMVGIGTNTPRERLHVMGEAEIDSTLYVNTISSVVPPPAATPDASRQPFPGADKRSRKPGRTIERDAGQPVDRSRQTALQLQTEGTTRVHIDGGTGDVGIGTETPGARLDVEGTLEAAGIRMPTGAGDNLVMTSDASGNASWELWNEGRVPNIVYADTFTDTVLYPNAGAKIAAAIAALPDEGGVVDARGIHGGTVGVNLFDGVQYDITLLLGAGTFSIATGQVYDGGQSHLNPSSLRIVGVGTQTLLKPETSMNVLQVRAGVFQIADIKFDLNQTNSTAVYLRGILWAGAALERLYVCNSAGSAPLIKVGEDWVGTGASGALLRDLQLFGTPNCDGIEVHAEGVLIDRSLMFQCGTGVRLAQGTTSTISNCLFWGGVHALVVEDYMNISFIGNDCESPASEGFIRAAGIESYFPIKMLCIRDNHFAMMNAPNDDVIYLKNVRGAIVEGNVFQAAFSGSGASPVVFDGGVTDVYIAGNMLWGGAESSMPGFDADGLELPLDDITATQSSTSGGFAGDLTLGGSLSVGDIMNLPPRDTPPASPSEGDVYMNGTTHKLMVFDGSTWCACW